ncbi:CpaD family pilus assembly protein [Sphingomonas sp. LaA6.9]|uniref:CpaD family pilus assembly protein n=1 Tax=Sphingomonas sp. LaA6.9 TaxID=2919914 RepID=UPI001F4F8CAF|nr:CpaD family pilus assembly protein [Sphingomonas sp. LaA6.9]MCJ8155930.1 CpaD family pilus assembly protein [Sphingomonas sp. LaA6.9]
MNSKTMKNLSGTAATALLLMLGGCTGGTVNPGMESVHQPVVQRSDYTLDLQAAGGGIAADEARRLATWFESLELGYGDRVSIDDPSGYGNEGARSAVAAAAARYGLLLEQGAPVTTGQIAPGAVRVVVSRTTASVPECPDWSRPSQPEYEASTMSNYGCASAKNLAAMIANPEDLIHGRNGQGGSDSHTATKAVKAFRDRILTGVSDVKQESSKGAQ